MMMCKLDLLKVLCNNYHIWPCSSYFILVSTEVLKQASSVLLWWHADKWAEMLTQPAQLTIFLSTAICSTHVALTPAGFTLCDKKHQPGQKQWSERSVQSALREQSKQQNPAPVLFLKRWMLSISINLPLSPLYLSISFFWQCCF